MRAVITSDDWEQMFEIYNLQKTTYIFGSKGYDYRKVVARYVAGCILYGLTEDETLKGESVFQDLYARTRIASRNVANSNPYYDIKATYKYVIKRIVLDNFKYKTKELIGNYERMKRRPINVDLSMFDSLDDD